MIRSGAQLSQDVNWGTGSRFRYTGQIALQEAKLYHYKARVYDPTIGRFLQTDPIGYEDDYNLYAYVGNDPAGKLDPTGQKTHVMITYGKPWGGMGGHAAMHVDGSKDNTQAIYDPGGSFLYNTMYRSSDDTIFGASANLRDYLTYESRGGDQLVKVLTLDTTPAEEQALYAAIESAEGQSPGFCACGVNYVLQVLPRFEGMWALTPDGLHDEVKKRQTKSEKQQNRRVSYRETPLQKMHRFEPLDSMRWPTGEEVILPQ